MEGLHSTVKEQFFMMIFEGGQGRPRKSHTNVTFLRTLRNKQLIGKRVGSSGERREGRYLSDRKSLRQARVKEQRHSDGLDSIVLSRAREDF